MKNSLLLIVLSLGVLVSNAQKEPYMTKSLTGQTIKNVQVETSGGSIEVSGSTGNYRIDVFVQSNNGKNDLSKEEIQKRLDEYYDLKVSVESNKLIAKAKAKKNNMDWKKSVSISFKIYVQQNVSTDLSTSGGSISLNNLSGTQNFETSGGSLSIESLSGKTKGHTSGGSIEVSNSKDDIDLTTSGGSIDASKCSGKIVLSTSGGSLKLEDLKGDIKANTSGGSVHGNRIDGALVTHTSGGNINLGDLTCSLETSTSGGNIDVEMNELKQFVKISNSGGNVNLTIPNKSVDLNLSGGKIKTDKLNNFSGSIEEESVKGKVNGGGIPITVDAGSGRVTLSMK